MVSIRDRWPAIRWEGAGIPFLVVLLALILYCKTTCDYAFVQMASCYGGVSGPFLQDLA